MAALRAAPRENRTFLFTFSRISAILWRFPLSQRRQGVAEGEQMVRDMAPASRRRLGAQGMIFRRQRIFARLR
jgi:hypothetical protein